MTGIDTPRVPRPRPARRAASQPRLESATTAAPDRARLIDDVLEEISSHTPADVIRHMRRWPSGPLSLVHLHVLTVLEADGPVPMGALAESLDVSQASATGIVDRMEQRGLVERRRDDDDRRVIRVALADGGREVLTGAAEQRRERLGILLNELSDDELDGFLRGSRALREARNRLVARWAAAEIQPSKPTKPPAEA
jgi:DNA-binding MarR family transcriptional regulator